MKLYSIYELSETHTFCLVEYTYIYLRENKLLNKADQGKDTLHKLIKTILFPLSLSSTKIVNEI